LGHFLEEVSQIFLTADTHTLETKAIAESEPEKDDITTEEKAQQSEPTQETQTQKPSTTSRIICTA
jgi:hypothetical protein